MILEKIEKYNEIFKNIGNRNYTKIGEEDYDEMV